MPSVIIVVDVWQILGRGDPSHPCAAPKKPILNRVKVLACLHLSDNTSQLEREDPEYKLYKLRQLPHRFNNLFAMRYVNGRNSLYNFCYTVHGKETNQIWHKALSLMRDWHGVLFEISNLCRKTGSRSGSWFGWLCSYLLDGWLSWRKPPTVLW